MDDPWLLHKLQKAEEAVTIQDFGHSTNLERLLIPRLIYRSGPEGIDETRCFAP